MQFCVKITEKNWGKNPGKFPEKSEINPRKKHKFIIPAKKFHVNSGKFSSEHM